MLGAQVHAPRRVLDRPGTELKAKAASLEHAIREMASSAERCYVRDIVWVPRVGGQSHSASDGEVEATLARLDVDRIGAAWAKALQRRKQIQTEQSLLPEHCSSRCASTSLGAPKFSTHEVLTLQNSIIWSVRI